MKKLLLSRREFMLAAAATGFTSLVGCTHDKQADPVDDLSIDDDQVDASSDEDQTFFDNRIQGKAFRLSTRGKRASRAAKAHAANKIFATAEAANAGRAHAGDASRIVQIDLSEAAWLFYFGDAATVIDLRECASYAGIATKLWGRKYAAAPTDTAVTSVTAQVVADRLSLAAGAPIDVNWVNMPVFDSTGEFPASLSLPCGTPVPFVLAILPDDVTQPLCPTSETLATRDRLETLNLAIYKSAADDGKLFSPVHSSDVEQALAGAGETIERKYITVPLINFVGIYNVEVYLDCNVIATVTISVSSG